MWNVKRCFFSKKRKEHVFTLESDTSRKKQKSKIAATQTNEYKFIFGMKMQSCGLMEILSFLGARQFIL